MLYRRTLKAFTLAETLVALVLMVIVVGLASSVINLTTTNIKLIQENENGYRDLEQLEFILELDVSRYSEMKYIDSTMVLKSPIDSVLYSFKPNLVDGKVNILRDKDTIVSQPIHLTMYYKGDSINSGIFDAIEIKNNRTNHQIFVYKPEDLHSKLGNYGF